VEAARFDAIARFLISATSRRRTLGGLLGASLGLLSLTVREDARAKSEGASSGAASARNASRASAGQSRWGRPVRAGRAAWPQGNRSGARDPASRRGRSVVRPMQAVGPAGLVRPVVHRVRWPPEDRVLQTTARAAATATAASARLNPPSAVRPVRGTSTARRTSRSAAWQTRETTAAQRCSPTVVRRVLDKTAARMRSPTAVRKGRRKTVVLRDSRAVRQARRMTAARMLPPPVVLNRSLRRAAPPMKSV
jgi:hypothetical protein